MLLSNQHCKRVQIEFKSVTPGKNDGLCDGVSCQHAQGCQICSLTMLHVSHPYLLSIICLFFRFTGFFYLLVMVVIALGRLLSSESEASIAGLVRYGNLNAT